MSVTLGERPSAALMGARGNGRDQSTAAQRAKCDVKGSLRDAQLGRELRRSERAGMGGCDRLKHRALALGQSVIWNRWAHKAVPPMAGPKRRSPLNRTLV